MKKEDKVIPLWLAKEIHEEFHDTFYVVDQVAEYYYGIEKNDIVGRTELEAGNHKYVKLVHSTERDKYDLLYRAFDVAELGELLERPEIKMTNFKLPYSMNPPYRIFLSGLNSFGEIDKQIHYEQENTEAMARGKMLLYLLKEELL